MEDKETKDAKDVTFYVLRITEQGPMTQKVQ